MHGDTPLPYRAGYFGLLDHGLAVACGCCFQRLSWLPYGLRGILILHQSGSQSHLQARGWKRCIVPSSSPNLISHQLIELDNAPLISTGSLLCSSQGRLEVTSTAIATTAAMTTCARRTPTSFTPGETSPALVWASSSLSQLCPHHTIHHRLVYARYRDSDH